MSTQFTATIQLYPTNEGGLSGPLLGGEWRVVLAIKNGHASALFTFTSEPAPGDTFMSNVELLESDANQFFQAGTKFIIWESGTKGVGVVETLVVPASAAATIANANAE